MGSPRIRPSGTARRRVLGSLLAAFVAPATAQGRAAATEDFWRAVRRDDPHALRTALLRGADANARDAAGDPAIVAAARNRAWSVVRALAELAGTQLDATSKDGANALMFAALNGELPVVQYLVSRNVEVNKTGWTPLHFAAANGHVEVIRFLLENHAYIDAESPNGTTPLMMAARQKHPTSVRLLIDEGADPTPRNQAGLDAAGYARAAGDAELATWLAAQADAFRRKYGTVPASRR